MPSRRRRQGRALVFRALLATAGLMLLIPLTVSLTLRAADPPAKPDAEILKKVPPGSVIIYVPRFEDGKQMAGSGGVFLTAAEYAALQDRIKQLEAQLKPEKPISPSQCDITGEATGGLARLKVSFKFTTTKPNQSVALGCAQGRPTDASLDGGLPLMEYGDDGFVVIASKPGDHHLALALDVPLTVKSGGGERGFDLDLPRAVITTLDLELPEKVPEVRMTLSDGGKDARGVVLPTKTQDGKPSRFNPDPLGAAGRLELAWKGSTVVPGATPLLAAESRTVVRLGEGRVLMDIDVALRVLRGQTAQWQIYLPEGATLVKPAVPDNRVAEYVPPAEKNRPHVLKLQGSSSETLVVSFRVDQQKSAGKMTADVGPVLVAGAFPQSGTVLVTAPTDLRTSFKTGKEPLVTVSQRDVTEEDRKEGRVVAAFSCVFRLADQKPFLTLDAETVKEQAAVTTKQALRLGDKGWVVTTEADVNPLRGGGVQSLQFALPPRYEFDLARGVQLSTPGGSQKLDGVRVDPTPAGGRTLTLPLPTARSDLFRVSFEGLLPSPPAPGPGPWQDTLGLPQPQKVEDRGGQVSVGVPAYMELLSPNEGGVTRPPQAPPPSESSWRVDRVPESLSVSWRSNRPETATTLVADVSLGTRQGGVHLRLWPTGPAAAGPLLLWLPDGVPLDRVLITPPPREVKSPPDAAELPRRPGFTPWLITPAGTLDQAHPLTLVYDFALDEPKEGQGGVPTRFVTVPLARAGKGTRSDLKVRASCLPGTAVTLGGEEWVRLPLEPGDGGVLPVLVIGSGTDQSPNPLLGVTETGEAAGVVQVDRVLVQASVAETGSQTCLARFRISHLGARHLDVKLPPSATEASLRVVLRLPHQPPREVVPQRVPDAGGATVFRLHLDPELVRTAAILDVSYQTPLSGSTLAGMLVETTLNPPSIRDSLGRPTVRWQVDLPPEWVAAVRSGAVEQTTWGLRGWLPAPRPAVGPAALEQWLLQGFDDSAEPAVAPSETVGVVCWQSSLAPISLIHVPQQPWLLVCSLALIGVAMFLYLLLLRCGVLPGQEEPRGTRRGVWVVFWSVLLILATASAACLLFWPTVLSAAIYGGEPGLLVVLLIVCLQWALHQRYRRQVVFMPGFSRRKQGSSLTQPRDQGRTGSHPPVRPRTEPSTVDAPPQPPGS